MLDILSLLRLAKERGASDLHLVANSPPLLRINGALEPMVDVTPLTPGDLNQIFCQIAPKKGRDDFNSRLELDFSYELPDVARFRCNAARQRGTLSIAIRLLPLTIPSLEELGLPEVCRELVLKQRGLVVVSGPTGSGKSTTLAAMIDYLNKTESRRIVTIEDPIEFDYSNNKCVITQRELGSDTLSFAEALKRVLRQDPDVIMVGEMRDLETATAVLTTAETGHLVITTGHAPSASQAIERIVDLFPLHERHLAQSRLASLLLGVLCQALIPRADGAGRIAAIEIMLGNPAVKNLIREGKIHQLPNIIRTHAQLGMTLLDECLVKLYRQELISRENLLAFCNDRGEVARAIGMVEQNSLDSTIAVDTP
jgi:twitching motility protein PilT